MLHYHFPAPDYWNDLGLRDIERARQNVPNVAVAKHVILFLGDGMGLSTVTAARILKGKKMCYEVKNIRVEQVSLFFARSEIHAFIVMFVP